MTDLAARIYDIRCFAESCSRELDVPLEAIVEHVASLGGADLYCQPDNIVGPFELRESIQRFCAKHKFDRLSPEEQAAWTELNKRNNTWKYDNLKKRLEPFLRHSITFVSAWDAFICSALHVPNPQFAHKYKGSEDEALDTVLRALKERDKTMSPKRAKSEDTDRTTEIQNFVKPLLTELGIYGDPFKTGAAHREAWGMNFAEVCDSDMPLDEVKAKFAKWHEAKKASKELTSYLNGKAGHNEPEAPQPGLFDDLNAVGEKMASLPAAPVKENVVPVEPPPTEPAAPPVGKTESAGDAIPEITTTPLPAPAAHDAGQSDKEVTALGFTLDFILDDTTSYSLTAAYNKETGDVWTAKAVVRGHEPDERTRPLIQKDVETNLRARKAADVVLDIEYEPTVEEINAVKNKCYDLASKTYPDLTKEQRLEKIKAAWSDKVAKDAIAVWGLRGAYDKVHEEFAKIEVEPEDKPETKPETRLTVLPSAPAPVPASDGVQLPSGTTFNLPTPTDLAFIDWYAEVSIASQMYPGIANAAQAKMVMIRGHFMGVDPAASMDAIYPIKNKSTGAYAFTVSAPLARALVERTRECEKFQVTGDDKKATAVVKRKNREELVVTFTIDDARKRNLLGKWNWTAATEVMLQYRAMTKAIKIEFPEIYYFFPEIDDEEAGSDLPKAG